jgi:hypothetical protein
MPNISPDGLVKSTNHVILNEVRMKNLSQLSTRFFPAESGLPPAKGIYTTLIPKPQLGNAMQK